MRIILGSDPVTIENPKINLRRYDFSEEMREYWLKRGISLALCGQVLHCIELIRARHVRIRYPTGYRRLHTKMYCSAGAVRLGPATTLELDYIRTMRRTCASPLGKERALLKPAS